MTITLKPETERYLREAARREGLDDVVTLIEQLVEEHRSEARQQGAGGKGERAVQRLREARTNGMRSSELMAMTRERT